MHFSKSKAWFVPAPPCCKGKPQHSPCPRGASEDSILWYNSFVMLRAVWSDFRSYRNGRTWWGTAPVSAAHFLSGIKIAVLTFYALTIPSLIRLWELHEGKKVSEMKAWIIQKTELPAIKQTDEKQNLFFRDLGNEVLVFFWQIAAVSCRQQTIQLDLTVERAENIFYFHATDALSSIRRYPSVYTLVTLWYNSVNNITH